MPLYLAERKTFTKSFFEDLFLGFMPMAMPKPITVKEDGIAMGSLDWWWFTLGSGLTLSTYTGKQSPKQNWEGRDMVLGRLHREEGAWGSKK